MNEECFRVVHYSENVVEDGQSQGKSNIIEINAGEFDKICRTCLSHTDLQAIQVLKYEDLFIRDMLHSCISLAVKESDCLPQHICMTCIRELLRMHLFKQKCRQNDVLLRAVLSKKIEFELKDEVAAKEVDKVNDSNEEDFDTSCGHNGNVSDDSEEEKPAVKNRKRKKILTDDDGVRPFRRKIKRGHSPGAPYKCKQCSEVFATKSMFVGHRKAAKHYEVRNYTCNTCSKKFTSSKLREHLRTHTKEKPFECNVCSKAFSMRGNLNRHVMTHTGERPHICEICGKGFIQANSLHVHRATHTLYDRVSETFPVKFDCKHCGRQFKRVGAFNRHTKRHIGENVEIKKSDYRVDEVRNHVCEICKRSYKTKSLLKMHQLTHGEKTFLCSECGKGFVMKSSLQSHLRVHTGEKPYTCSVCRKSFSHIGSFEAHMLIHTGQKPFNCNICTKSFTQASHLTYHLRTHTGERPYICSFCGKTFALKGNLTVHVRTHTGETPYLCPVCGKGFYDSSSMKKHRRGHGEITLPPLNKCNKS